MEANEAMKAMADRIADKMYPRTHPGWTFGVAPLANTGCPIRRDGNLPPRSGLAIFRSPPRTIFIAESRPLAKVFVAVFCGFW